MAKKRDSKKITKKEREALRKRREHSSEDYLKLARFLMGEPPKKKKKGK